MNVDLLTVALIPPSQWVSFDLADRVAHSYMSNKEHAIIENILSTTEIIVQESITSTIRSFIVAQRSFMMEMRNTTALKDPQTVVTMMKTMFDRIETNFDLVCSRFVPYTSDIIN